MSSESIVIPNWKGFRYVYDNYIVNSSVKKVVFNGTPYYLPKDRLKVRFELEFFCNRKRMIEPGGNFVLNVFNSQIEIL